MTDGTNTYTNRRTPTDTQVSPVLLCSVLPCPALPSLVLYRPALSCPSDLPSPALPRPLSFPASCPWSQGMVSTYLATIIMASFTLALPHNLSLLDHVTFIILVLSASSDSRHSHNPADSGPRAKAERKEKVREHGKKTEK